VPAARRACGVKKAANQQERIMSACKLEMLSCEPRSPDELVADVAESTCDIAARSTAALAKVRCDIIVGEGSTVTGRLHFSRTIDGDDTALCARILVAAGRTGLSVSRAEAEALFAIDAAGSERCDDGRFDDLLAKAVIHHLMSAAGAAVPSRERALAPEHPLAAWSSAIDVCREHRSWLTCHLDQMKPSSCAARTIRAILRIGFVTAETELPLSRGQSTPPLAPNRSEALRETY
jgi:hypothetical protein